MHTQAEAGFIHTLGDRVAVCARIERPAFTAVYDTAKVHADLARLAQGTAEAAEREELADCMGAHAEGHLSAPADYLAVGHPSVQEGAESMDTRV